MIRSAGSLTSILPMRSFSSGEMAADWRIREWKGSRSRMMAKEWQREQVWQLVVVQLIHRPMNNNPKIA